VRAARPAVRGLVQRSGTELPALCPVPVEIARRRSTLRRTRSTLQKARSLLHETCPTLSTILSPPCRPEGHCADLPADAQEPLALVQDPLALCQSCPALRRIRWPLRRIRWPLTGATRSGAGSARPCSAPEGSCARPDRSCARPDRSCTGVAGPCAGSAGPCAGPLALAQARWPLRRPARPSARRARPCARAENFVLDLADVAQESASLAQNRPASAKIGRVQRWARHSQAKTGGPGQAEALATFFQGSVLGAAVLTARLAV
jgi:hypothetical protein